jgi:hypothetical protein
LVKIGVPLCRALSSTACRVFCRHVSSHSRSHAYSPLRSNTLGPLHGTPRSCDTKSTDRHLGRGSGALGDGRRSAAAGRHPLPARAGGMVATGALGGDGIRGDGARVGAAALGDVRSRRRRQAAAWNRRAATIGASEVLCIGGPLVIDLILLSVRRGRRESGGGFYTPPPLVPVGSFNRD